MINQEEKRKAYIRYVRWHLLWEKSVLAGTKFTLDTFLTEVKNFTELFKAYSYDRAKVFVFAMRGITTPTHETLIVIEQTFKIPILVVDFYAKINNEDSEYIKFLQEGSERIPPNQKSQQAKKGKQRISTANKRRGYMRYVVAHMTTESDSIKKAGFTIDTLLKKEENLKKFGITNKDAQRDVFKAFKENLAQDQVILFIITKAFKIPVSFGEFYTDIDTRNPKFLGFLTEAEQNGLVAGPEPILDDETLSKEAESKYPDIKPIRTIKEGKTLAGKLISSYWWLLLILVGASCAFLGNYLLNEAEAAHASSLSRPLTDTIRHLYPRYEVPANASKSQKTTINLANEWIGLHNDNNILVYSVTLGNSSFLMKSKYAETKFRIDNDTVTVEHNYNDYVFISASGFKSSYRNEVSDSIVGVFITWVNNMLLNDFKGTSKITGTIWGHADGRKVDSGKKYKNEWGGIMDEPYYFRPSNDKENKIERKMIIERNQRLSNLDIAFLRAYHMKKSLLYNIRNSLNDSTVVSSRSLELDATTYGEDKKDPLYRKVDMKLQFEGVLGRQYKKERGK